MAPVGAWSRERRRDDCHAAEAMTIRIRARRHGIAGGLYALDELQRVRAVVRRGEQHDAAPRAMQLVLLLGSPEGI
jgi:hypothetical protein